ncbi:aspartate ammonia-lyase [Clostridium sediminicola]|uniref:aspartate ammonia-lyase n=1 Tax=Clostridium sediminicola TaxID=3114879 RepID=UPI0031F1C4CB
MGELSGNYRIEKDSLGKLRIHSSVYYGIHTARALENFSIDKSTVNLNLIYAMVTVKKAAAMAHKRLKEMDSKIADAIVEACDKILDGHFDDEFRVNPYQGGAGTSTNMNVNEVVANIALEIIGEEKGRYDIIHPIGHVNLSQSTNDVYPTSLRIAAIKLIRKLSKSFAALQETLQEKENEFADIIKLGRTQLMDAVPIMVGQEFGAYAKAIARDRWRIYKVEERLREMNIGGTAVGTGINASQKYIYIVTDYIQSLTGLGMARSDYPIDTTQNMDVFVEVSGLLKSAAVNFMKISNDLRLLNSGPKGGIGEIILPSVQAGSSIMPGKVNPVIPEMVAQVSMKIIANDSAITTAAYSGQLQLNAFGPLISHCLLESLELMDSVVNKFKDKCINNISVDVEKCNENLQNSTSLITAVVNYIGYDKAAEIAKKAMKEGKTIKKALEDEELFSKEELENILNPYGVTSAGTPGKKGGN